MHQPSCSEAISAPQCTLYSHRNNGKLLSGDHYTKHLCRFFKDRAGPLASGL